jgi:hypothetical protein
MDDDTVTLRREESGLSLLHRAHRLSLVRVGSCCSATRPRPRTRCTTCRHPAPAAAVVAAARPTGWLVAGNPELVLTLLVNRADGTSFETVVDKVTAANLVGHIQVGRVVTVHYLPGAEHELALQLPINPHL